MLYVTTRIDKDAFTAHRALSENRGPEGGFYVPMRLLKFDYQAIVSLAEQPFSENVARILNLFFGTRLNGWDVELAIGRYPVKMVALNSRTTVIKTWHNPVHRFERMVYGLEKAIRQSDRINETPSDWLMIATRIALLFATYGLLLQDSTVKACQKIDVALPSGDLSAVMAAWYAKGMGLPIGTIICCCNENNGLWNFFHRGVIRTDAPVVRTYTPACDYAVPTGLERLIFSGSACTEVLKFCEIVRKGGVYCPDGALLDRMLEDIHVRVVGSKRMGSAIPNLYKTTGFVSDPYTALAYSGLMDYRAATGTNVQTLIIAEESPLYSLSFVSECMSMTPDEVKLLLD